jgi:hypothetical protein
MQQQGPTKILTVGDIADYFFPLSLSGQDRADLAFHAVRWAHLLSRVDALVRECPDERGVRVLDVGVSLQTQLLRHNYPGCVDTLDIVDSGIEPGTGQKHTVFDLNDLYYRERWPVLEGYDVVVMCEVIEHLYTPSVMVLAGVATWMKPGGHLFVQTPNAVALHKRVKAAFGRHPYMDLSAGTRLAPPHFREYTIRELISAGQAGGLEVVRYEARNYFTGSKPGTRLYNRLCEQLPPSFRAGIAVTYRRPATAVKRPAPAANAGVSV